MARPDDLTITAPGADPRPEKRWRELLDGRWYPMRLMWSLRDHRWYLDVADDAGTAEVNGLAIEPGCSLLAATPRPTLPPGQLFVEDIEGLDRAPDLHAWSSYARLYYRPESVVAIAAGTADEVR